MLVIVSDFFAEMCAKESKGHETTEFTLENVDSMTLHGLVVYFYTGQMELTTESIQAILPIASQYKFIDIQKECLDFATQLMCENFMEIQNTKEFLHLDSEQLFDLIKCDELRAANEMVVFVTVMKWIKHAETERNQYLEKLLGVIRLGLMSKTVKLIFHEFCFQF